MRNTVTVQLSEQHTEAVLAALDHLLASKPGECLPDGSEGKHVQRYASEAKTRMHAALVIAKLT